MPKYTISTKHVQPSNCDGIRDKIKSFLKDALYYNVRINPKDIAEINRIIDKLELRQNLLTQTERNEIHHTIESIKQKYKHIYDKAKKHYAISCKRNRLR